MIVFLRVGLAILALIELVIGIWTQYFPESFYNDYPSVDLTPPYSEHLMRDFGGASLGLAVVLSAAAIWPQRKLVVVALIAYLVFSVPHFVFHSLHLQGADAVEATTLMVTLGVTVALPVVLLVIALRTGPKPATMVE